MRASAKAGSPGTNVLLCPSAQPTMPSAVAIGVIDRDGTEPEVAYLEQPLPVSDELLAMAEPVRPTEVFRFAAPCQTAACSHWSGQECKLVDRIVDIIPPASLLLPTCRIRPECRWFSQAGRAACTRCPRIVTQNEWPSEEMRTAAMPR
jgi:hypothetical protein